MKTFVETFIEQLAAASGAIDTVTKFLAGRGIHEKGSGFTVSPDGRRWETSVVFASGGFRLHGEIVMCSHFTQDGDTSQHPHVPRHLLRLTKVDEPEGDKLDLFLGIDHRTLMPVVRLVRQKKPSPWIATFVDIEHRLLVGLISPEKAVAEVLEGVAGLLAE